MAKYESSTIYVYSFEDSSSVSSGDISDAINDISTDDVTTGSSLSGDAAEREAHAHQKHRAHQQQQVGGVASSVRPTTPRCSCRTVGQAPMLI